MPIHLRPLHAVCACAAALLFAGRLCAGQVNFVYPVEGYSMPAVQKTFVFGNVSPSTSSLTINGEKVEVHSNGGFIAYLPVAPGDFAFTAVLGDGTTAQRLVKVRQPEPAPSTATLQLALTAFQSDTDLPRGEYLKVTAAGTPAHEAVCSLEDVFKDLPMEEVPPGSGRYFAAYLPKEADLGKGGTLSVRFKAGLFGRGATAVSKGQVRLLDRPVLVETSTDTVILKNATDGGYMMFLPKGVKLVSDGRVNGYRRVSLSAGEQAWVDDSKVQAVPGPGFPFGYGSETGVIKLTKTAFGSSAAITLYERLPYTAEVFPWGLRLTLYYANLHTNWVLYDSADELVKNVSFRQAGTGKVEIDLETAPDALWGYDVSYPNGSKALQVDLRARPKASLAWPRPLSGVTVVLDPGHSVYYKCRDNKRIPMKDSAYPALPEGCGLDGAVGPMATFEVNVNLEISKKLARRLSDLGAAVRLTRTGDENVELGDRPKLARDLGGDLFISVHNNAIGDGEDPAGKPRGFSVYHYHRHGRPLAAALHRSYLRNIQLPDEGLRFGDYLVARMTWMPAALIENAYMILPRQEELLNTPSFQERLADAMAEGVLEFFGAPRRPAAKKVKR
ncbi:MAG: N-acetylmuramoyl-L-alanine amidase family protein [Elusimicrobiales bacterium]